MIQHHKKNKNKDRGGWIKNLIPCRDDPWWRCNRFCGWFRLVEDRSWRLQHRPWIRNGVLRPTWFDSVTDSHRFNSTDSERVCMEGGWVGAEKTETRKEEMDLYNSFSLLFFLFWVNSGTVFICSFFSCNFFNFLIENIFFYWFFCESGYISWSTASLTILKSVFLLKILKSVLGG